MTQGRDIPFDEAVARVVSQRADLEIAQRTIRGHVHDVIESPLANLRDVFIRALGFEERDFVVYNDRRLTFQEFWDCSLSTAQYLHRTHHIGPGDRVAIAMRNRLEWIISFAAIVSLGGVAVPMNSWWQGGELAFGLSDAKVKLLLADQQRLDRLSDQDISFLSVLNVDDDQPSEEKFQWLSSSPLASEPDWLPPIDTDDDFCIMYTSGSTGRPKGVVLTHRGVLTALQSWSILADVMRDRHAGLEIYGDDPAILMAVPLFHVAGLHSCFLNSLYIGRKVVMMPKWKADNAVELINREQITNLVTVPTMTEDLIRQLEERDETCPSLVDVNAGGAKLQSAAIARIGRVFPNASPSSGYAMTETNALGAVNFGPDYLTRPESTGRPVPPVTTMEIRDEDGRPLPCGRQGEIWIKSPANFRSYLNLPKATAETLVDGWVRTGDLGRLDEQGYVYIEGRLKNLIIRGGENIAPLEVETVFQSVRGVAEVSVFGLPDDRLGEIVAAVVSRTRDDLRPAEDIVEDARSTLAQFKLPSKIWTVDDPLPRTATQKLDLVKIRAHTNDHDPDFQTA